MEMFTGHTRNSWIPEVDHTGQIIAVDGRNDYGVLQNTRISLYRTQIKSHYPFTYLSRRNGTSGLGFHPDVNAGETLYVAKDQAFRTL